MDLSFDVNPTRQAIQRMLGSQAFEARGGFHFSTVHLPIKVIDQCDAAPGVASVQAIIGWEKSEDMPRWFAHGQTSDCCQMPDGFGTGGTISVPRAYTSIVKGGHLLDNEYMSVEEIAFLPGAVLAKLADTQGASTPLGKAAYSGAVLGESMVHLHDPEATILPTSLTVSHDTSQHATWYAFRQNSMLFFTRGSGTDEKFPVAPMRFIGDGGFGPRLSQFGVGLPVFPIDPGVLWTPGNIADNACSKLTFRADVTGPQALALRQARTTVGSSTLVMPTNLALAVTMFVAGPIYRTGDIGRLR